VLLSGGSGTRLWPVSRATYPKQFLPLVGAQSLFEQAAARVGEPARFEPLTIVCNEEHRFLTAEQARANGRAARAIILESAPRNTAAAVTVAALSIAAAKPEGLMLVMPSDLLIRDDVAFLAAVDAAARGAHAVSLMTFGIHPTRPDTGFGYIEVGDTLGHGYHSVRQFVEKPDAARAAAFVAGGRHLWNSGLLLFRADVVLAEMRAHQPGVVEACERALAASRRDLDFTRLESDAFARAPSISIDKAVMERTGRAGVVPCDLGWSDLGSWEALWNAGERDAYGNVAHGDVLALESRNCLVHSSGRLVSVLGLEDTVVVETDTAVLVAPRRRSQDVKTVAAALEASGRAEAREHSTVHRPWGWYRTVDRGDGFQVKRLQVNPGARLSLQLHNRRSEHWVCVRGEARVTRGDDVFTLLPNQSTHIPIGVRHRLENTAAVPLEMIEVQCGGYLGEDDIVRFLDTYGRS
jgi:mannose-1-phosphate guanylyltransferase/mannose-6-phosphate isomerase